MLSMVRLWAQLSRYVSGTRTARRTVGSPSLSRPRKKTQLQVENLERRELLSASPLDQLFAHPGVGNQTINRSATVRGLTPSQIRHAYGFDQFAYRVGTQTIPADGRGTTIAIVDAFDNPNVFSDLHKFDVQFGLPDPVFVKATPQGRPRVDAGWALEIALDVEWAHAVAPKAKI